ncbi:sugar ABC transporter substrate-binding protein [Candidatus Atribacteria bacterium 1244-E10-H5-B2]|nr:MAG: sugar ABC transporter substrate-binding protein [Candidatus Atribacteria bacterium 1244-E10-H5-B2]
MKLLYQKKILCITFIIVGLMIIGSINVFADVTIKYANWQWLEIGRSDILQSFVDQFEVENPGIKIEKVPTPYSAYNDALTTSFEAGGGPDIFFVQDMALVSWINKEYLEPLDNWITLKDYAKDFPPQQIIGEKNGKTYAIIYEGFPYGALIYNKVLLDKASVDVPKTPDELLRVSDAVYEATGKTGLAHPTNFANPSYIMQGGMIVIEGFGGRIVKDGKFEVKEPEFIKGVEFLKEIYNLKSHPGGMEFGLQRQQFLDGEAAMVMDGSYWPGICKAASEELYKNIGVARLPFPDPASPFETNWYAINAQSSKPKKEVAAKFIQFLLKPEQANKWAVISGIPGLKFTYDAVEKENPWFKVYAEVSPYGIVRTLSGHESDTPEIRRMVADAISFAMSGKVTPKEAMNKLQEDLEKRFGK